MENSNKITYLSFVLGEEIFAVNVGKVLEVLEHQKITRVPKTPSYIKGVINFRGEILPVIDTRLKLNLAEQQINDKTVIIVLDLKVKDKSVILGAMADSVKDVIEIHENEIRDVPDIGNRYNVEFLQGMVKIENIFVMLLNVDKVFLSDEQQQQIVVE